MLWPPPPVNFQITDQDVEEAVEAGNATMTAGEANQSETANGNMTEATFLSIQHAKSGSISEINATA